MSSTVGFDDEFYSVRTYENITPDYRLKLQQLNPSIHSNLHKNIKVSFP